MARNIDTWLFLQYEMGNILPKQRHNLSGYSHENDPLTLEQISVDKQLENDRLNWADFESQVRDYQNFYKEARPYSTRDWKELSLQKARVLGGHKPKFDFNGKQPLIDKNGNLSNEVLSKEHPEMYVGKIFHEVYSGVEKFLRHNNKLPNYIKSL